MYRVVPPSEIRVQVLEKKGCTYKDSRLESTQLMIRDGQKPPTHTHDMHGLPYLGTMYVTTAAFMIITVLLIS